MTTNDRIPIKTTGTAFDLLEVLAREGETTLPELAGHLEMPTSTVHDHLLTLQKLGYVVKTGNAYRVSTRLLNMGESARRKMKIFPPAKKEVDKLAAQTGEHAALGIEENGQTVLLYISKGEDALNLGVSEGFRMAMPTNCLGKAMLAFLPDDRVEEILDRHGLPEITDNSLTSRDELYEQLDLIRDRRYATDVGERVGGVNAVAAPIVTEDTVRGALAISAPANRMEGDRFEMELPNLLLQSTNVVEVQYTLGE
ncbi:IclR family transcriptional regulator [Halosolutus amylolyticus]|uniref:IclR family transcriptional regulator n=1 Tax=Halosolutus amylolyticus TaxID=2932267 RepID=A0ABD5PKQ2_9EURY|nr:IclR family transcriptional regulator [Halosolutus amylolyticus]